MEDGIRSPRTNLHRLLREALGASSDPADLQEHVSLLRQADADNKLRHQKLYLILDLDETLVWSQRMEPGSTPRGTQIVVHGSPFDVVLRPGLEQFLMTVSQKFKLYLYTMGDEEYTKAVLKIIDPENTLFTGGICCWRQHESRSQKSLDRVVCSKSMALIADDSAEVWGNDLENLCLVRRFVGDAADTGLQQLSSQLQRVHAQFYSDTAAAANWNLDDPEYPHSDVRHILARMRGTELSGCRIALTGLFGEQTEEIFGQQPLCMLLRLYGGTVCTSVDEASHLVARQKSGWRQSFKIRRAAQRCKSEHEFVMVWDNWLLDTLCSWQRQNETAYLIPTEGVESLPAQAPAQSAVAINVADRNSIGTLPDILVPLSKHVMLHQQLSISGEDELQLSPIEDHEGAPLPARKRPREPMAMQPRSSKQTMKVVDGSVSGRLSVADYLRSKGTKVNQQSVTPTRVLG
eukprot:CAMPEP_0119345020 /NCGR_PEP_ID=MMETSP1333-20130426/107270_1 /TAXON_ID=418940 /ORGANISM="Scyphosphaera apsteinii, Strain RCC1455" /LENGTH=461 /DNA_ID=CAMNT_0007357473 /DNA_START=48 /DNA_END=1433 /DNA_ORIENTATION=-